MLKGSAYNAVGAPFRVGKKQGWISLSIPILVRAEGSGIKLDIVQNV